MDITWYGLSCFRIREGGATVVCDPYDKSVGLSAPKLKADIVTSSHDRPGHNSTGRIGGDPKVIVGPGEYEVKNVFVTGASTRHRKGESGPGARNIVFFFDFGTLVVGHLGDLGEVPTQSDIDELNLGEVDILIVPVGGGATLDPTLAVEVIGMFEPRLIIPMHYRHPGLADALSDALAPVDQFLTELGLFVPEPESMLKISKSSLPEETQVVLLTPTQ